MNDIMLKEQFLAQIDAKAYPCVMARAALASGNIQIVIAEAFCPTPIHARRTLDDIYAAIDKISTLPGGNHSIALLFRTPVMTSEEEYDALFWPYLQCLHELDRQQYGWDSRVSADPQSEDFSFSLKGEAFYLIGMHNMSSRKARTTQAPAIIFNLHRQFDALRAKGVYNSVRDNIRRRDIAYAGDYNPMLQNFGDGPEVLQYTGRYIDKDHWQCPFQPQPQQTATV